jgi:hypothetical protein
VVLGLGVHAAELVAGGQERQRCENYPRVAVGQIPSAPQQDHRGEDVGHVVNDIVKERPVDEGERLADPEAAGEETVRAVDEERDQHQPKRLYSLALEGGHEHQEREHRSARRVQVHGYGFQPEPGRRISAAHISVFDDGFFHPVCPTLLLTQRLMIPASTGELLHTRASPQRADAVYGGRQFMVAWQAHLTGVSIEAAKRVEAFPGDGGQRLPDELPHLPDLARGGELPDYTGHRLRLAVLCELLQVGEVDPFAAELDGA